jgi:hypothetical protein
MTTKNKIFTVLSAIFILIALAWTMNRYVYNWFHYTSFLLFPCAEKGVRVSNAIQNSYGDLGELLDVNQVANSLKNNPNYTVSQNYISFDLFVTRKFEGKEFKIIFNNYNSRKTTYFEISSEYFACSEPDYSIEQSITKMIEELPISIQQKSKISDNIQVTNYSTFHAF